LRNFRRYACGAVRRIREAHPAAIVSMNGAAEALLRRSWSGSRTAMISCLQQAKFYPFDPTYKDAVRRSSLPRVLYVNVPSPREAPRCLEVCGFTIMSIDDLDVVRLQLKRHKPILRACESYFKGELSEA